MTSPSVDLRPAQTAYLQQRLTAFQEGFRHNLAVLGPAGSGKSHLLQQALAGPNLRVATIFCSLQREPVREFVKRMALAVLHAILAAPPDAPLEMLLQQAGPIAPRTVEAVHQLERYMSGSFHAEAFTHTLDLIPVLHHELQRPCVLALDEFLALEELGLSHAFHELGKRVMTWPFAWFLLASSSPSRASAILRERLQLLFGQFEVLSLGAIETPAAMAWMQQELRGSRPQPALLHFLLHWLGTSPWALGILLKRMKELTLLKQERRATEATLFQAAWDVLGSPDGVLYHWCAGQLERLVHKPYGDLARGALLAIARGARSTQAIAQQIGTRSRLPQALQLLVEHDLVQRKGACWVIPDQLLGCWLSASMDPMHQRQTLDRHAATQRFEHALKTLWSHWVETTSLPLAERVSRLFSLFSNETICLDHKTARLPTFRAVEIQRPSQPAEHYLIADGEERRWCCLVHEGLLEESSIAAFEQFCRSQPQRPSRKVVIAKQGLELNAKLLAKEANMWVWEPDDMNLLFLLYEQPTLPRT